MQLYACGMREPSNLLHSCAIVLHPFRVPVKNYTRSCAHSFPTLLHARIRQVLGVPKGAGEAQIKNAYRKLAIQYHPDKTAGARGCGMQNCPCLPQARQCPLFTTICQVTRRWKKSSRKSLQPTLCFQVGCDSVSLRQNMKCRRV